MTHNVYLQQLAETGVVGLVLLLVVFGASRGAAARAARRFDALGDPALATLARAVVSASIGFLTASSSSPIAPTSACGSSSRSGRRCSARLIAANTRISMSAA